jgi:hypothetical protein
MVRAEQHRVQQVSNDRLHRRRVDQETGERVGGLRFREGLSHLYGEYDGASRSRTSPPAKILTFRGVPEPPNPLFAPTDLPLCPAL